MTWIALAIVFHALLDAAVFLYVHRQVAIRMREQRDVMADMAVTQRTLVSNPPPPIGPGDEWKAGDDR